MALANAKGNSSGNTSTASTLWYYGGEARTTAGQDNNTWTNALVSISLEDGAFDPLFLPLPRPSRPIHDRTTVETLYSAARPVVRCTELTTVLCRLGDGQSSIDARRSRHRQLLVPSGGHSFVSSRPVDHHLSASLPLYPK